MGRWVLLLLLLLLNTTTRLGFAYGNGKDQEGAEEVEMMVSESTRKLWGLQQHRRYISYELLRADVVPCSIEGVLYYNCRSGGGARVNAYHRGCGLISRCARYANPWNWWKNHSRIPGKCFRIVFYFVNDPDAIFFFLMDDYLGNSIQFSSTIILLKC